LNESSFWCVPRTTVLKRTIVAAAEEEKLRAGGDV
jgi:hypothetical protein